MSGPGTFTLRSPRSLHLASPPFSHARALGCHIPVCLACASARSAVPVAAPLRRPRMPNDSHADAPVHRLEDNPLRRGLLEDRSSDACAIVIFGASGDLTRRKLMPALYNLACGRSLPAG